jgi:hypothetical protein
VRTVHTPTARAKLNQPCSPRPPWPCCPRWCLSGTPIQNTVDDLLSYFRFLRYQPYCHPRQFKELIKDKIAANAAMGFKVGALWGREGMCCQPNVCRSLCQDGCRCLRLLAHRW